MSVFQQVPSGFILTSGVNSALTWTNAVSVSSMNVSSLGASNLTVSTLTTSTSVTSASLAASTLTVSSITANSVGYSTLSGSTINATRLNYSSIVGSSISSNSMTLSLTAVSTQNTQIYQVATTNPTTSYTAIQASHVSTGTTNNALALNPSGGNVGVGTTTPGATVHAMGSVYVHNNSINSAGGFIKSYLIPGVVGGLSLGALSGGIGGAELPAIYCTDSATVGINTTTPSARLHVTGPVANASVLQCWMTTSQLFAVTSTGNSANASWNATDTILRVSRDTGSGRSINAGGTFNASGADYAEYMTKDSDFSALKGDLLGVLPSGKLTNQFDAAIHFLLKSTNPCMVGGDVWGTEAIVGEKPKNPEESATEEEKAKYAATLAAWESRLEAERQKVDRMAFAGQVPVNIQGTTPGDYIIPLRNVDGTIGIAAVSKADVTFAQYQNAVGRVISILADGRANVIVKAV